MKTAKILKAFIPSFILLLTFTLLDLSRVPFVGRFLLKFYMYLLPDSIGPMNVRLEGAEVWWIGFLIYFVLVLYAVIANFKIQKVLNEDKKETAVNLIISGYKYLSIITGLVPFCLGLCFLIASISLGPEFMLVLTFPLLIKGVLVLFISLFQICIYHRMKLFYL